MIRPILFTGPMVRAVLDDRKTQTRRVIVPQIEKLSFEPGGSLTYSFVKPNRGVYATITGGFETRTQADRFIAMKHCPYGTVGDELWVKESWRTRASLDRHSPKTIADLADDAGYTRGDRCPLQYAADGRETRWGDNDERDFGPWGRWRPSIFMPRWASRITLEIIDVRVQRVQEITAGDAYSEGIDVGTEPQDWKAQSENAMASYRALWNSINAKRGFGWDVNPWVWAITFKTA